MRFIPSRPMESAANATSTAKEEEEEEEKKKKKKKKQQCCAKSKRVEVERRSRRITKCDPPRVVFPTIPRTKTPSRMKVPPTPNTRANVEARTASILRKSPRIARGAKKVSGAR
ncbi:hypothetical protein ACHAW5_005621 [Stephanodiscus triporus]|uniref:Uncharacterized protein n=1 Tax=Stephanodiscus triporus TaxID=2934178 RepID=A0ABD3PLB3_9STRA